MIGIIRVSDIHKQVENCFTCTEDPFFFKKYPVFCNFIWLNNRSLTFFQSKDMTMSIVVF